jgi:hypothetical protein
MLLRSVEPGMYEKWRHQIHCNFSKRKIFRRFSGNELYAVNLKRCIKDASLEKVITNDKERLDPMKMLAALRTLPWMAP